jgi:hypothetical protein
MSNKERGFNMSDNFTNTERKEVVYKLLKVSKFQNYDLDQKIDLLKTHFVFFKEMEDQEIENYMNQLIQ